MSQLYVRTLKISKKNMKKSLFIISALFMHMATLMAMDAQPSNPIANKTLVKQLKLFAKQREQLLIDLQNSKIEKRRTLDTFLHTGGSLPTFAPNDPYLLDTMNSKNSDGSENEIRSIRPNPEFDQEYFKMLGIAKHQRLHSGNHGQVVDFGMFDDFANQLRAQGILLNSVQQTLLEQAARRFKDNYRSSKKDERAAGAIVDEIGRLTRGFQACKGLLKDTNHLAKLFEETPPVRSRAHSFTAPTASKSHVRQRSNSDTAGSMPHDLELSETTGHVRLKRATTLSAQQVAELLLSAHTAAAKTTT